MGANVYLTPPGTQGFAPHYDDIEAFVVQLEGKKVWKVYPPMNAAQTLPRFSSGNFKRAEITSPPLITVELEPGDLLYFPRGYVHEAHATEGAHSLHITLSTCQRNTWGDLLEKMIPQALQTAIESDIELRESLPRDYLNYTGVANQEMDNKKRDDFLSKVNQLASKIISHVQVDSAVDQHAKSFVHDSLPPVLNEVEKQESIFKGGESWDNKRREVTEGMEMDPDTAIKLIRYGIVRVVMEKESVLLYHSMENTRQYREVEPQYIEIGAHLSPAVEYLLHSYPNYVRVEELPLDTLDDKVRISSCDLK